MQSGEAQGNLWEQSDLLDLVATPAATPRQRTATGGPQSDRQAAGEPLESPVDDDGAGRETQPASTAGGAAGAPGAEGMPESTPTAASVPGPAPIRPLAPASDPASSGAPAKAEPAPTGGAQRPDRGRPACPERLLILDTETTGLSPEQGECIEVGAVLFAVAQRAVLMQVSFLLPCENNPAQHVNGIPAAVSRLQQPWRQGLSCFEAMATAADAVLAHNVGFDRQWFGRGELPALEKPWICSMEDIRWPAERHLRPTPSVRDLSLAYGVPVWAAHRALTDCIYLVQVFQRCDDLETLLLQALEPRQLVRARLSYDERHLAREAGFRWNEPVPKAWSRRLSEREIAALPFPVDPVEPGQGPAALAAAEPSRWRRSA